jgi:hypothetical protein
LAGNEHKRQPDGNRSSNVAYSRPLDLVGRRLHQQSPLKLLDAKSSPPVLETVLSAVTKWFAEEEIAT